jgi:TRAP-type C4-dicarboxylate transport system permease small subunit
MESYSTWEALLLGLLGLAFIFWMKPGIKASLEESRNAKSDWMGLLVPIGFVIMFVIFLIAMV